MNIFKKAFEFLFNCICMPLGLLIAVCLPIMAITQGNDIIANGYSFADNIYFSMVAIVCFIIYISLRFKGTRKIYAMFPCLFQFVKMITIAGIMTATACTIVNWAFKEINDTRRIIGIILYILILLLWRIGISIYYTKKPIVPFIEKKQEMLKKVSNVNKQV